MAQEILTNQDDHNIYGLPGLQKLCARSGADAYRAPKLY